MFPAEFLQFFYDIINQICSGLLSIADKSFWFGIFPYIALFIGVYGLFHRYTKHEFSYSSHSSQFLNREYTVAQALNFFHYGLGIVLGAHLLLVLLAFFAQEQFSIFSSENGLVLLAIEVFLWTMTVGIIIGMIMFFVRRFSNSRLRVVTTKMDWVLLTLLLIQVSLGLMVATFNFPGSQWYVGSVVPWFVSLGSLNPIVETMGTFDGVIRFHALNGFVIFAILPYTRLVHLLSFPYGYLTRKYQVVVWYARNKTQTGDK
jgi:nitrate reductase gamma subunit